MKHRERPAASLVGRQFEGVVGDYLRGVTEQWLLVAPSANPAMLAAFDDRDVRPYRDMVAWVGEFPGKHLTAAVEVWRATGDPKLEAFLREFVPMLLARQDKDGYLGVWPRGARLKNHSAAHPRRKGSNWDTWSHYHVMLGLLAWDEAAGDRKALAGAQRIADLFCDMYLGRKSPRLVDTPEPEKNLAPVHALAMLYRKTGQARYLALAEQWVGEFGAVRGEEPLAGNYLRLALAGKSFYQMPKPRWEALHSIMALAELHGITGNSDYGRAFEQIWWSIVEGDRHNNGGFSSAEEGTGNPYDPRAIESCCTIAWIAMSVEMLKLTGNSVVADELELSTLNSVLGMHSSSGRWATYNTPSDGLRCASAHHIVFQARAGGPELNCCSVNSPRGLGLLSAWAVVPSPAGIYINYYGPSRFTINTPQKTTLQLVQETDYPRSGAITLQVIPQRPTDLTLHLRIPAWSRRTRVKVNGQLIKGVGPGSYLPLTRRWKRGDKIAISLDFSVHAWRGERECAGLTSLYRGPILLAWDLRFNHDHGPLSAVAPYGADANEPGVGLKTPMPRLDFRKLGLRTVKPTNWHAPHQLFAATDTRGRTVYLCDFASAGHTGTPYRSWLPVAHAPPRQSFSQQNPLRTAVAAAAGNARR